MTVVLGIETSCDETAVAVVADGRRVLSNVIASQAAMHGRYGGVVPEVAARQHLTAIIPVVRAALEEARVTPQELDAVAVTYGPGLAGTLLVGVNVAKALAYCWERPLIGVNHLEAHLYANWLEQDGVTPQPPFPLLGLIVSGGHTDLVVMRDHGQIERLGRTLDDAAGEAFDKVARLLDLGFPGGPAIERVADGVAPAKDVALPRAWLGDSDDFSFSGLKTAVLHVARGDRRAPPPVPETAAAFQEAVVDVLTAKTLRAAEREGARSVLISGGVAANGPLRAAFVKQSPVPVFIPARSLCTDNGAMIGACAYYRLEAGRAGLGLDVEPALPVA